MRAIEKQLTELFTRDTNFDELENALDKFCPFEAIGMVNQEIRHAHFLSYILDPRRPHMFGSACLRAFIVAAVSSAAFEDNISDGRISPIDIHLMDLENVIIRREWRRIDLLIEVPTHNLVLAIELKIDASEHSDQLNRYEQTVKNNWPNAKYIFIFLTKNGDDVLEGNSDIWLPLGFDTIICAFTDICERAIGNEQARSLLLSYISMLGRRHLSDERLEYLASELWAKHKEALEFLMERQPNALSSAMTTLLERKDIICNELSAASNLTVVFDSSSGTSSIRFAVKEWDDIDEMPKTANWTGSGRFILAELRAFGGEVATAYVVLGRGDTQTRNDIYKRLLRNREAINRPEKLTQSWKRLSSKTLVRLKEGDDSEIESLAQSIESKFIKAVPSWLIEFDRALREREWQDI